MENFDPSKLIMPTAVNPRSADLMPWKIRVQSDTKRVSLAGVVDKFNLKDNGINFALYPVDNSVIIWPIEKEKAMTAKGAGVEYKMGKLVEFLEEAGVLEATHKTLYLDIEEVQSGGPYYRLIVDKTIDPVLFETEATPKNFPEKAEEPSDEEIEKSVEASN